MWTTVGSCHIFHHDFPRDTAVGFAELSENRVCFSILFCWFLALAVLVFSLRMFVCGYIICLAVGLKAVVCVDLLVEAVVVVVVLLVVDVVVGVGVVVAELRVVAAGVVVVEAVDVLSIDVDLTVEGVVDRTVAEDRTGGLDWISSLLVSGPVMLSHSQVDGTGKEGAAGISEIITQISI